MSTGDPLVISDLSYEDLRDFHPKFYHPANSRILFLGGDDVKGRLDLMYEYFSEFEESPESKPGSVIEWQKNTITEPKWETYPYTVVADYPKTNMVLVNWLVNDKDFMTTENFIMNSKTLEKEELNDEEGRLATIKDFMTD